MRQGGLRLFKKGLEFGNDLALDVVEAVLQDFHDRNVIPVALLAKREDKGSRCLDPSAALDQPFVYLQRNRVHVTKIKGFFHVNIQNRAVIAMDAEAHITAIGKREVAGPV